MRFRSYIGWGIFFSLVAILIQLLPSPKATYYFLKGKHYSKAHDYEAALRAYQESVKSDPDFARGYVELGVSYYTLDNFSEAEGAFRKAIALENESCAVCGLGMVYRAQGRKDEAERTLRKAIELNPSDSCAYNQIGRLYYDLEDYGKASEAFSQDVKLSPSAFSYHFLANSMSRSGQMQKSIEPYLQATRLDPKYEEVLVDLANAYHVLGREKEATEVLERAIKLEPNDQKARAYLGVTKLILGDRKGAMEQYEWLREKNPKLAAELLRGFDELAPDVKKLELLRSQGLVHDN